MLRHGSRRASLYLQIGFVDTGKAHEVSLQAELERREFW